MKLRRCPILLLSTLSVVAAHAEPVTPIQLSIDASAIARRMVTAQETIPVPAGATELTLVYPKWIPGNHGPTGLIADLVDVHFNATAAAKGVSLKWHRDAVDMYAFHIAVPAGTVSIEAQFTRIGELTPGDDFGFGNTSTPSQGDLNFDEMVLYPAGSRSDDVRFRTSVRIPAGWSYATALKTTARDGSALQFDDTSLTTLVDSPLLMGSHLREFDITPRGEARRHTLTIAEESEAGLDLSPARIEGLRNVVAETGALFGARHYAAYHFLVEAHAEANNGLEHHQSSDNQVPRLGMVEASFAAESGYLLSHEFFHSWNGKYRRPAGLATPNYQEPMDGRLLWVYEGLTSYYGEVLAARAGLMTPEQVRSRLADHYAQIDSTTGRGWRPLQETATAAQILYPASGHWESLRRATDFYIEGPLLWLDVDAAIRSRSNGHRSLDDFARAFYGGESAPLDQPYVSRVIPYEFADVVAALNAVVPYDWAAFLRERLDALRPVPPAQGLEAAGWRVVYTAKPGPAASDTEAITHIVDARHSLGLSIEENGEILDLVPESPAGKAGLRPELKIVAVNHRTYSPEVLRQALAAAQTSREPIELLTLGNDIYSSTFVDYHGGERYPQLQAIPGRPDLLAAILKARR